MHLHADFSKAIIITPQDYQWITSPRGEVNRMMLERIGVEKARATSLVEFLPQSKFPEHVHPLGEEVLVLSGIFTEDEEQHYPEGWYMLNPHQSAHQVSSYMGCKIFVKLMQMTEHELEPTRINTQDPENWLFTQGRTLCPLFESKFERTFLETLDVNQHFSETQQHSIEILIISGELFSGSTLYPSGTWIRLPQYSAMPLYAATSGATIYVKMGHLQHAIDTWGKDEAK